MSAKRNRVNLDFSTSFLDLCCCALGGVILLMVLLVPKPGPKPLGTGEPIERTLDFVLRLPVLASPGGTPPESIPENSRGGMRPLLTVGTAKLSLVLNSKPLIDRQPIVAGESGQVDNLRWSIESKASEAQRWLPGEDFDASRPPMPKSLLLLKASYSIPGTSSEFDDCNFQVVIDLETPETKVPDKLLDWVKLINEHSFGPNARLLVDELHPRLVVTMQPTQEMSTQVVQAAPVVSYWLAIPFAFTAYGPEQITDVDWVKTYQEAFGESQWPDRPVEFWPLLRKESSDGLHWFHPLSDPGGSSFSIASSTRRLRFRLTVAGQIKIDESQNEQVKLTTQPFQVEVD